ncbi:MAG: hypothetical protein ABSG46_07120 [Candidatus Binataceae bacterium]
MKPKGVHSPRSRRRMLAAFKSVSASRVNASIASFVMSDSTQIQQHPRSGVPESRVESEQSSAEDGTDWSIL